jgi:hypothetical protein
MGPLKKSFPLQLEYDSKEKLLSCQLFMTLVSAKNKISISKKGVYCE